MSGALDACPRLIGLDLLDSGNWEGFLMLHGSHEQLPAFLEVLDSVGLGLMSHADYWRTLREVWQGHDVVHRNLTTWRTLFRSPHPDREHLMTETERARLADLPERVTVHRGFSHPGGAHGLAWTLDLEQAEWFARRFARLQQGAWVRTVTVARERIVAMLDGRGESEAIIPNLRGYRPATAAIAAKVED